VFPLWNLPPSAFPLGAAFFGGADTCTGVGLRAAVILDRMTANLPLANWPPSQVVRPSSFRDAGCSLVPTNVAVHNGWHHAARMAKPGSQSYFAPAPQYRVVVRGIGSARRGFVWQIIHSDTKGNTSVKQNGSVTPRAGLLVARGEVS
jgi:hypothetical protein